MTSETWRVVDESKNCYERSMNGGMREGIRKGERWGNDNRNKEEEGNKVRSGKGKNNAREEKSEEKRNGRYMYVKYRKDNRRCKF